MQSRLATWLCLLTVCSQSSVATADPEVAVSASVPALSKARIALPFPEESGPESPGASAAADERVRLETICGPRDDSQDVEHYDGSLGPTKDFVKREEPSTAQLQWRDLTGEFNDVGDDKGNVSKERWCSGTLIARDLVLTAGHCVQIIRAGDPTGWVTPRKRGSYVEPADLVRLMHVNFNYQKRAGSDAVRVADVFPITKLEELGQTRQAVSGNALDYAIVRIGKSAANQLPGDKYAVADFVTSAEAKAGARLLTVVQHPDGVPKRVDAGPPMSEPVDIFLRYNDLDTLGGSSGAGIIDQDGRLIGVHTNGGCSLYGGFNYGVSLEAIARVSDLVN